MSQRRLRIFPTVNDINSGTDPFPKTIHIESVLAKGSGNRVGIIIESKWRVDSEKRSINLVCANLVARLGKTPLTPFDVPDRHLRAARKVGAAIFEVKRFDNLQLFEIPDSKSLYLAKREGEKKTFVRASDAKLWLSQLRKSEAHIEILPKSAEKATIREAQQNSAAMRSEMLKLLIQTVTGISAMKRIRTLLKRGIKPTILEDIWNEAHEHRQTPESLKSILYGQK